MAESMHLSMTRCRCISLGAIGCIDALTRPDTALVEWQKSRSTQTHLYRVDAPPCRLYVTPASVPQMHHSERGGCVERRRTATKQVQELAALRKSRGCREHQVVTPFGYVHSTDHHDVVGVLCKGKEEGCEQGGVSDNKILN